MPIKPRILVVDDEPVIADTLAMILNQSGLEARAAYSGEQALELACEFAPEMLISDVIMAGHNGIETAIMMRSLLPQIKVLLFSGRAASAELLMQARERGYEFELLAKPVHPKDLLKKVQDTGIDPVLPVQSVVQTTGAPKSWIDIAPGELPIEPVGTLGKEN